LRWSSEEESSCQLTGREEHAIHGRASGLIVSDQRLFAGGMRSLVEEAEGVEVVGIVSGSGETLIIQQVIANRRQDLVNAVQ